MNDIYEEWRSYENDRVLLRPVRAEDAADLLKVYADSKSREMFNCDNFETPCFFGTMEQMEREICFYLDSYRQKAFVRWVVVDKAGGETVGTIELFHRKSENNIGGCGFFCGCCPDYRSGNCAGCREAHVQGDCFTLDCINEKKLEYCPECGKFPCDLLLAKKKATVLDQAWMLWKRKTNEGDSGKEEE